MGDDSSVSTGDLSIVDLALAYARYGLRIFPVNAIEKSPMPGYGWYELASDQVNHVYEDFDRAMQLWGDQVSVAWALGRDGCVAIDVDVEGERIPDWMTELVNAAVINITRRGQHLIFKMPDDTTIGNGTSGFPSQGWGEVRGQGGYIIIAGPDRPGLDLGEMTKLVAFPRPEYLTTYGGPVDAVSKAELLEFANAHSTASNINMLNGLRAAIEAYTEDRNGDPARGRHPFAVWAMCEVATESLQGFYAFKDGFRLVQDWWRSVTPPERHGREWVGICCWAVGRALSKQSPPTTADAGDEPEVDLMSDNNTGIRPLDWTQAWNTDPSAREWLVPDLLPLGRSCSLTADAKAGKSDLTLYLVACLAQGRHPWTGERIEPVKVAYFDFEMTIDDVIERMRAYGYNGSEDWSQLDYYLLPPMQALDTKAGARQFLECVAFSRPQFVIVDTLMRTLDGDENDAATFAAFYNLVGISIKRDKITMLRLDHFGKDKSKGTRGSSAKDADVDVIWSMTRPGRYSMKLRSRSRVPWVPETLYIERWANPHVNFGPRDQVIDNIPDEGEHDVMKAIELLNLPPSWGRDRIRRALVDSGYGAVDNNVLAEAIRLRKLQTGLSRDDANNG